MFTVDSCINKKNTKAKKKLKYEKFSLTTARKVGLLNHFIYNLVEKARKRLH